MISRNRRFVNLASNKTESALVARDSGLTRVLCSCHELTLLTNRYASQTAKDVFVSQVHPDTLRNFRSALGLNSRRFNDKSPSRKKVV